MVDNDLISREALFKAWDALDETQDANLLIDAMIKATQDAPAVDAVEVVRCKDCKHSTRSEVSPEKIICCLTKMCGTVDPDYFCADGEREIDSEVEG